MEDEEKEGWSTQLQYQWFAFASMVTSGWQQHRLSGEFLSRKDPATTISLVLRSSVHVPNGT